MSASTKSSKEKQKLSSKQNSVEAKNDSIEYPYLDSGVRSIIGKYMIENARNEIEKDFEKTIENVRKQLTPWMMNFLDADSQNFISQPLLYTHTKTTKNVGIYAYMYNILYKTNIFVRPNRLLPSSERDNDFFESYGIFHHINNRNEYRSLVEHQHQDEISYRKRFMDGAWQVETSTAEAIDQRRDYNIPLELANTQRKTKGKQIDYITAFQMTSMKNEDLKLIPNFYFPPSILQDIKNGVMTANSLLECTIESKTFLTELRKNVNFFLASLFDLKNGIESSYTSDFYQGNEKYMFDRREDLIRGGKIARLSKDKIDVHDISKFHLKTYKYTNSYKLHFIPQNYVSFSDIIQAAYKKKISLNRLINLEILTSAIRAEINRFFKKDKQFNDKNVSNLARIRLEFSANQN